MLVLQCTKKLLTEGSLKANEIPAEECAGINVWYANLLWCQRSKGVLFTNAESLLSIFVWPARRAEIRSVGALLVRPLGEYLEDEGIPEDHIHRILEGLTPVLYARTSNRSVLGSMTDFAHAIACWNEDCRFDCESAIEELNRRLNQTPMSAIGYDYPISRFREMIGCALSKKRVRPVVAG